jgi:MoaA/NifB/PqqE/SkfB family radical SAM enzyme
MEYIIMDIGNKINEYSFSIIVTEKCNMHCTYCHFFEHVTKKSARDMSNRQLINYFNFINYFKENIEGHNIDYRFSGGDPIVLGDRLFEIADMGYKITGVKPYFLTAGNGISENWIEKARRSSLSACMISIENPLNPDPGAMNPYEIMKIIKKYDSEDFRLLPGVTVVRNENFKDIYEISRIVYEEIGLLPKIQEINYGAYESPTDEQLESLYDNLYRVVRDFKGKTYFDYFSYISPIYNACHHKKKTYLSELNFENKHMIGVVSDKEAMRNLLNFIDLNYPKHDCEDNECDWFPECSNVKWLWKKKSKYVTAEKKILDYCRLKKTINDAYYNALATSI